MNLRETTRAIQRLVEADDDGLWGPQTARLVLAKLSPAVNADEFDNRTESNLAGLLPSAVDVFRPFIRRARAVAAADGVNAVVICGFRDAKTQEAAKLRGASRAGWGYSWHNYGSAIDFGLFRGGSYLDSDDPATAAKVYREIGTLAADYGIEWGGTWTGFRDAPHFQIDVGRSSPNASDRRKLDAGTWDEV